MNKKWISIWVIYVIGLASLMFGVTFVKHNLIIGMGAMLLSVICVFVYYYRRSNYKKALRNDTP